jgi:membrane fusion protein (multidrug efflux system)
MKHNPTRRNSNRSGHPAFWLWFSAAAVLTGSLVTTGCGKAGQPHSGAHQELPTVQTRTQVVESKTFPALEEVVGTVRARLRATLEAKANGRITQMPVVLGQRVKAGELVVRLDAPEIRARLEQAQATLQQAEQDWKRVSALFEQQAATRADFDAANSRHLLAKAGVAEASAMLAYVDVLAPFDGVVARKYVDVGDLALPGKPLIDIEDPSHYQLEADVPETIAAKIQPDAKLAVQLDRGTNDIVGTVAEIAPIADPLSRTFRVKLDLPGMSGMMSGLFARLFVPVGEAPTLRVPVGAVVQRGQMEIVFVVQDGRAVLHLVKTGRRIRDQFEILSGLDSGDNVVVENASLLTDGQPVQAR